MKQLILAVALLAPMAMPALAQGVDAQIEALARPWLAAENPGGDMATIDGTVACVMAVLRPLPEEVKATMAAQDDFEDALDAAVMSDESLEQPLEMCF